MMIVINSIALLAIIIMVFSNNLKTEKKIITGQMVALALFCVSNILAGSMTGFFINGLGIGRNCMCLKGKLNKKSKGIIIISSIIIGIGVNNTGLIGLLPVIANVINTAYMKEDIKRLKWIVIVTSALWGVHDFYMGIYTSTIIDIVNIVLAGWFLLSLVQKEKCVTEVAVQ